MHAIIRPAARVAFSRPAFATSAPPAWKSLVRPACGQCSRFGGQQAVRRGFSSERDEVLESLERKKEEMRRAEEARVKAIEEARRVEEERKAAEEARKAAEEEAEAAAEARAKEEASTIHMGAPNTKKEAAAASATQTSTQGEVPTASSDTASTTTDKPSSTTDSSEPSITARRPFELPSSLEKRRSELQEKFSQMMDDLQHSVMNAGKTLNDVTGYSSIETIKNANAKLEVELAEAHERVRAARQDYKTSNTKRAATQREVTTLLARKDAWSPTDLERFTELYRADHVLEGKVQEATASLTEAEADEQSLNQRLNAGILKRYHEEQIWSDRIRRASTWGTWGLMGMNFLLFVVLQFVAEPWKRRRLVRGVVEEEKAVLEEVRRELEGVKAALAERVVEPDVAIVPELQEAVFEQHVAPVPHGEVEEVVIGDIQTIEGEDIEPKVDIKDSPITWQEYLCNPQHWKSSAADAKAFAKDLASERVVQLTMKEMSILALEGAAAGVALAVAVGMVFLKRS